MSDENNTPIDIDTMSDEDFMKLDPSQMQEFVPEPEEEKEEEVNSDDEQLDNSDPDADGESEGDSDPVLSDTGVNADSEPDEKDGDSEEEPETSDSEKEPESDLESKTVPKDGDTSKSAEDPKDKTEKPKLDAEGKPIADPVKAKPLKAEASATKAETDAAMDFFTKVSASFKADGREMKIKSPEDAVRLMQMGVNYSRRMEEMKPLRAQDAMLKANGLNDVDKLNFLIDLSKGTPAAIKKLLKDHKIDPIDIDTADETPYSTTDYRGDPKDIAFQDAIDNTQKAEGGPGLISDINREWDAASKEALRDQPVIFQNILAQKVSGVYSKIKTELEYQRTMGFLTDVPFLQAYHQVGEAMQKQGVFDTEVQPTPKKVLGTGPRKAALKPKPEQPTPNVSSATTPRSAPPSNGDADTNEPDYAPMSDEDFLKMAPPG